MKIRFTLSVETQIKRSGKYRDKQSLNEGEMIDFVARMFSLGQNATNRIRDAGGAIITCSPEAFSRFLIERNNLGFLNTFRELKAEIIEEVEPSERRIPRINEGYN